MCGDGFVDEAAGEECDPGVPESFEDACRNVTGRTFGVATCDPTTCEIIADIEQCAICGDDIADPFRGEECDGIDLRNEVCPGNAGTLRCADDCTFDMSDCEACGNGTVEEFEECDFREQPGGFGIELKCSTIAFPIPNKPYTSGDVNMCTESCRWNRVRCGYCGDGEVDDNPIIDDLGTRLAEPEVCDGDRFATDAFDGFPEKTICDAEAANTGLNLRPNLACNELCDGLVVPEGGGPNCCVAAGSPCPSPGAQRQCCFSYAHPELADDQCESPVLVDGTIGFPLCRPTSG